ncbi:MAG: hypothetical protein M3P33_00235 [bacterium]|nr:hypothetical protein [bacterium]
MVIKYLYALFIGLLFALFIGIGISTFYPRPEMPKQLSYPYPEKPTSAMPQSSSETAQIRKFEEDSAKNYEEFNKKNKRYNRDVSIYSLGFAILALIISLTLIKSLSIISDGLLTGGIFLLLYSIGLGFESDDSKFRFTVITISFIVALIIGYLKFVRPKTNKIS